MFNVNVISEMRKNKTSEIIAVNRIRTKIKGSINLGSKISGGIANHDIFASFFISKLDAKKDTIGITTINTQPIPLHIG
jgi:hypothetical protein